MRMYRDESTIISTTGLAASMARKGISIRGLAALLGVSHQLIGHLRSGKRHTVTHHNAVRIEDALDVDRGTLFAPVTTRPDKRTP